MEDGAILDRVLREDLLAQSYVSRDLEEVRESCEHLRRSIPESGNSQCKGPGVRVCLVFPEEWKPCAWGGMSRMKSGRRSRGTRCSKLDCGGFVVQGEDLGYDPRRWRASGGF